MANVEVGREIENVKIGNYKTTAVITSVLPMSDVLRADMLKRGWDAMVLVRRINGKKSFIAYHAASKDYFEVFA